MRSFEIYMYVFGYVCLFLRMIGCIKASLKRLGHMRYTPSSIAESDEISQVIHDCRHFLIVLLIMLLGICALYEPADWDFAFQIIRPRFI